MYLKIFFPVLYNRPTESERPDVAEELSKMKGKPNQGPDGQKQGLLSLWREK
jgi:hypothetical protein